jgi:D-tyrosyl-tRNA(Tyr) deacylase
MRAVVQRVGHASVAVRPHASPEHPSHGAGSPREGTTVGAIGRGLLVLLGVRRDDSPAQARWMAHKIAGLRVFPDDQDRMNRSVRDIAGEVLVVSQFTLFGDCGRGFRPSFVEAAPPELAEALYERVCAELEAEKVPVARGRFRAMMDVSLVNDGPVTIWLESP